MPRSADNDDIAADLARDELIGRQVRVSGTGDPTLAGLSGTVVDETMKTLTLEVEGSRRVVGKLGQSFTFTFNERDVLLDGEDIAYRPEDRIKKARVKA